MSERRYVPGVWFTVVTERTVAMLSGHTLPEIVEQVWAATQEGVSLDDLREVLTSGRTTSLPAFALVGLGDDEVRAHLHGEVTLEVFGDRGEDSGVAAQADARHRSHGEDVQFFSGLGDLRAPVIPVGENTTMYLRGTPSGGPGPWLPVGSGVILSSALSASFGSRRLTGLRSLGAAAPIPDRGLASNPVTAEPIDFDQELHGDTILQAPRAVEQTGLVEQPEHVEQAAPVDQAQPVDFDEELDGHTIVSPTAIARLRSVEPPSDPGQIPPPPIVQEEIQPVPPPPPEESARAPIPAQPVQPPSSPPPGSGEPQGTAPTRAVWAPSAPLQASSRFESEADHDGLTVMSSDLVEIRSQLVDWKQDAVPGPFQVPQKIAPAKLILSTGIVVTLDRTILIGRAPVVSRVSNRDLPRVVAVDSPNNDISRTHVQVRAEGHRVFVTDLNSTNGVTIAPYGQEPKRIRSGVPTVLGVDAVVDIGDGVTFRAVRH